MIAADIGAHKLLNAIVDLLFATNKRILQTNLIRLRLNTGDVLFLIGHQLFGIPGAKATS